MTRRAAPVAALVAALAATAPAPPARAAATTATAGVRGGELTGFAWDPTHATTVWAAVRGAGLYKSANGGGAWSEIHLPTIAPHTVNRVLPSKAAADLLFACDVAPSQHAIWRSGDGAVSFAGVLPSTAGSCTAIADGASAGTLYAAVQDNGNAAHFYKSVDAGKTWTLVGLNQAGVVVTDIVKLGSGRIVIGTRDGAGGLRGKANSGALYYSDDEGAHFTAAVGPGTAAIAGIAFNGTNELLALTVSGANATVYSSSDGANWAAGTATASGAGGGQIAYHAVSDSFFLMATNDKLLQSSNAAGSYAFGATDLVAGASAPVHLSLGHHAAFVIDPADATHLVVGEAAGGEGILVSSDGGGSWGVSNDGLFAQSVDFAFKTPSGYRYAANRSGFVYFGGAAIDAPWTRLFRPADSVREATTALAYDSAADKHVVVAQSNLVDVSVLRAVADATATGDDMAPFAHGAWTTLTYPDAGKAPVVALLVDGMTMFAGVVTSQSATAGQYLYTSTNGGTSWQKTSLSIPGGVRALAFDPSKHATLYAGGGDYKSDLGRVSNAGGLWKSSDGGATFTRISVGSAALDAEAPRVIVVDGADGKRIWVWADRVNSTSGTDGDIFESLDGGATWATITPSGGVTAFTYSPAEGLLAYATAAANVNVFVKVPGDGTSAWSSGFGVYGTPNVLYAGSIGAGTGTGLYEASGVMIEADDLGLDDDGGAADGMLPVDDVDAGGGGPAASGKGCGCGLVPAGGAGGALAFALLFAVRLLFRRRAAPARPRA